VAAWALAFAIPVSTARLVLDGIVKDGQVTRGWIGVEPSELSPELAETFGVKATEGVIITGVLQGWPSRAGGHAPGDVIVQVDDKAGGQRLGTADCRGCAQTRHATPLCEVQRGDAKVELNINPGVRPQAPQRA
jgi:serine protease DegQ